MAFEGCDMIANLNQLPDVPAIDGVKLKRAFPGDKADVLAFVQANFSKNWVGEAEMALLQRKCFIATRDGKMIGFACFDSSAKGYFGPIGVLEAERGKGTGTALLLRTLEEMKADGYGYAVIGWVSEAEMFYRKTIGAEFIPGGTPDRTVYRNMIVM